MDDLVTTDWLERNRGAADLRIVDASYFLPDHRRDAQAEYLAGHIPGAVFLDLASFCDPRATLPSTIPPAGLVETRMAELGIGEADRIVMYDDSPLHSAARAWWLLKGFGARSVAILDGGYTLWRDEGRPPARGIERPQQRSFTASGTPGARTLQEIAGDLGHGREQVIDARSPARFEGREPEQRAGVVPGHIPGSRNLHYAELFDDTGRWKRGDALRQAFADAGIDPQAPLVATCGSGITAAVLVFGAHLLGNESALYDGSWAEWGADPTTPKATGPA